MQSLPNTSRFLRSGWYRLDGSGAEALVRSLAMHELGIMESALASVLATSRAHGGRRVHRIVLRVGALSGAEPEALQFAFAALSPATAADGATLEIELLAARAYCADCAAEFEAGSGFITACPRCRRLCGDLRQGRELELTRIELHGAPLTPPIPCAL